MPPVETGRGHSLGRAAAAWYSLRMTTTTKAHEAASLPVPFDIIHRGITRTVFHAELTLDENDLSVWVRFMLYATGKPADTLMAWYPATDDVTLA